MAEQTKLWGVLAEFDNPLKLMKASEAVRDAGYTKWDTYTPYPVHGLEKAMGLKDSWLPFITLGAGITGCAVAILMQWWMNAVDYPINISGKPMWSLPANIPVAFELTVLFAALSTFGGMMFLNDLPKFYHPTFRSKAFKRVTTDRFFLAIEAADPRFDQARTEELLRSMQCTGLQSLED